MDTFIHKNVLSRINLLQASKEFIRRMECWVFVFNKQAQRQIYPTPNRQKYHAGPNFVSWRFFCSSTDFLTKTAILLKTINTNPDWT